MEIIIIGIIVLVIVIIVCMRNTNVSKSQIETFKENIDKLALGYKFTDSDKNNPYDLIITNDELVNKYLIKFIKLPEFAEVQINNFNTWEVKYGAGNTPGKVQPHKKYLSGIDDFINYKEENTIKVVVFTPAPKKIVKYINECEIVFVDHLTDVYGLKMIPINKTNLFKQPFEKSADE